MSEQDRKVSRRDFLRMAGLGAGAGAATPVLGPWLAEAARKQSNDLETRPWWVKQVDEPTVGKINEDYKRFTGLNSFAFYADEMNKRYGEGAYEEIQKNSYELQKKNIENEVPGYTLRDYQIKEAGWTVYRSAPTGQGIWSWNRIRVPHPSEYGVEKYKDTPEEMAKTVKAVAKLFGAGSVGITEMQERFIPLKQSGKPILFEDAEAPIVDEEKFVIPKSFKTVIAFTVEMAFDLIQLCPTALGSGASSLGYSRMAFVSASLAEYIRGLGYEAIPTGNDTGLSIPFAVHAGLGEMSRMAPLITPEYGPAVRLAKVYTDMPMAYDKPISFGVAEFCRVCKRCAEACPNGALNMDDNPSFETTGPWNHPGHEAWHNDYPLCREQWDLGTTSCMSCFTACPYTKQDAAWIHDIVKATTSTVPATAPIFRSLDETFAYGETKDPERWWNTDNPAFGIYSTKGTDRS